ncbi:MAG: hypothetical protein HY000_23585 [Planctomycetes bacterium]|nr:hypothetical protein [Planctomycetota bacterium]
MTKRTSWLLALGLQLMLATTALGQDYFEPFAPVLASDYGGPPRPRSGVFFAMDYINWAIGTPHSTMIGDPILTPIVAHPEWVFDVQRSMLDTSEFSAEFTSGQRGEIGWYGENGHGWMLGGWGLKPQNQTIFGSDVDVVFIDTIDGGANGNIGFLDRFFDFQNNVANSGSNWSDGFDDDVNENNFFGRGGFDTVTPAGQPDTQTIPWTTDFGDLRRARVSFDELRAKNSTSIWNLELMHLIRLDRDRTDGTPGPRVEFGIGPRFMQFDDEFDVQGFGGFLGDSRWNTRALNNSIGPQAMVRAARSWERFTASAEGRFFAGWNFQTVRQRGTLADQLDRDDVNQIPANFNSQFANQMNGGWSFNNRFTAEEFNPTFELRLMLSYRLTQALSFRGGWTGFYSDGLARPAEMVVYQLPGASNDAMGINGQKNRTDVFVNGYNVGIEYRR